MTTNTPCVELRAAVYALCDQWEIDGEALAKAKRGGPPVVPRIHAMDAYTLRRAAWELRQLLRGDRS